jgi:hypothetical protein
MFDESDAPGLLAAVEIEIGRFQTISKTKSAHSGEAPRFGHSGRKPSRCNSELLAIPHSALIKSEETGIIESVCNCNY